MAKLSPAQLRQRLILLFSIALLVWPGERAMSSTLDHALIAPVVAFCLAAVAVGASRHRALGFRAALGAAAFEALAPVLLALSLVHLANAWLDQGPATEQQGVVRSTMPTRRGPRRLGVDLLAGGHLTLPTAVFSDGCTPGMKVYVRFRAGALGSPWVESGRCTW